MDKKPIQPAPERNKDALAKQSLSFAAMRDRLTQYMESKAMRKTPERYEVLRVANMSGSIFTIDELMTQMQQHGEFQVSRATLFNTMELLCEAGLAIKHPLATAARFEMQTDSLPKAYVICHQCNTITRVSTGTARMALQNLHVRYFSIEQKLVYMHGLCRKCQARNRQEARKNKKEKKKS